LINIVEGAQRLQGEQVTAGVKARAAVVAVVLFAAPVAVTQTTAAVAQNNTQQK
jgi:hypothetical protein